MLAVVWGLTVARAGDGLCVGAEETVYACPVSGGRQVAVCREGDRLTYRFGRPGAVELTFPPTPRPAAEVFAVRSAFGGPRVSSCALSFENEGHRYALRDGFFHGEEEHTLEVQTPSGKTARLPCVGPPTGSPCAVGDLLRDGLLIELAAEVASLEQKIAAATCLTDADRAARRQELAELAAATTPLQASMALHGDPLAGPPSPIDALEASIACP